ncbi:MAG: aminopeptidase P family protein [Desulfobacterales bacterium]|nr:aminopeptidase P family protein [Desulfobacterales bacterium]
MNNIISERLSKLRNSFDKHNIDTLMVLIEENRRFLSGYTGEDTQFDESAGALFISKTKLVLATDGRFDIQARSEAPDYDVVIYREGLHKSISNILKNLETNRIGFEGARLSFMQHKKINEQLKEENFDITFVELDGIVEQLRMIKSPDEIESIRKALLLAEESFILFQETFEPGMTEKEAAWELEKIMRENGADRLSFPTIVASGPNSALPHAVPGNRKIRESEPVLFDWGIKLNGYCSDISRTTVIGKPDDMFRKVYQTVFDAQYMAIDAIKPGSSAKAVDAVARNYIHKKGFKGKFDHSLGHGVGLAIHELPRLSPISDATLEPGMVTTVEPGIYIEGWGGVRIENMVAVTDDGADVLNAFEPAGLF